MNRNQEILRAISEAASILDRCPVGKRTSFDILGAVHNLGIPVLFRPLRGLWGAAISVPDGHRGILVTTKLDLHVQRFTLAHELGHLLLGHGNKFDPNESIGFAGRFGPTSRPTQEIAADTFASEILAPKNLLLANARRHNWTSSALRDPANIYQLSLRLGISFQAACWALAAQKVLAKEVVHQLNDHTVKSLKLRLAPAELLPNPWANVWNLAEADTSTFIEAGLEDLFVIRLHDHASAGYLWELVSTGPGVQLLDGLLPSRSAILSGKSRLDYGEPTSRATILRFETPGVHRLHFEHRRPWNKQTLAHIDIEIDNNGKERGGLDRRTREAVLLAGAA